MKKLLGATLSLVLILPYGAPASAELFKNLKVTGALDVQATSARNVTDFTTNRRGNAPPSGDFNDRIGDVITRTWASLGWDLLEDVHAKVTLRKNDRAWGSTAGGAISSGGQGAGGSQAVSNPAGAGGTGVLETVVLNEANVKIDKLAGGVDATVGRQFYGEPGDLIAYWGPTNVFGLFVNALDALRLDHSCELANFTGVAGRTINPAGPGGVDKASQDVRGADFGWKNLPVKVNTFIWNRVVHAVGSLGVPPGATTTPGVNDNLWVYGLKLKGEAMGGWLSATLAANSGQNRVQSAGAACTAFGCTAKSGNYIGKALLVDAGYKADLAGVGGLTPWFNFGWGSGRSSTLESSNEGFQAINSDYRPGVIYGRFASADINGTAQSLTALGGGLTSTGFGDGSTVSQPGLNNKKIWGLGTKFTPAALNKLTAGASFWDFSFQRATQTNATATPLAVGNRHIGSELDLQLDWTHSENVGVSVGWASFQPGGFVKEVIRADAPGVQHGNSPVTMAFADLNVRF